MPDHAGATIVASLGLCFPSQILAAVAAAEDQRRNPMPKENGQLGGCWTAGTTRLVPRVDLVVSMQKTVTRGLLPFGVDAINIGSIGQPVCTLHSTAGNLASRVLSALPIRHDGVGRHADQPATNIAMPAQAVIRSTSVHHL